METDNILSWWSLCLLFLLVSQSACQSQGCSEFKSPLVIQTFGTSVGTIKVPITGAGDRYKSNQFCEWNIMTNIPDYGIRLDVKRSDMQDIGIDGECNNDYVDIFDFLKGVAVFMDRFCGRDSGKSYLTTGNKMTIRFYSDDYLELTGFEAAYQPVPVDTRKGQDDDNKKTLDMAVGIPVGILTLTVVVIVTVFIIRYCRRKKAARSTPTTALTQNPAPARLGLPGGYHPSDTSTSAEPPAYYQDPRVGSSDFFPRNVPLQVVMSGSARDGYRNDRSATPPPAYDSLDFGQREVEHSEMPLTPPPYEMLVKQYMGPSNG